MNVLREDNIFIVKMSKLFFISGLMNIVTSVCIIVACIIHLVFVDTINYKYFVLMGIIQLISLTIHTITAPPRYAPIPHKRVVVLPKEYVAYLKDYENKIMLGNHDDTVVVITQP